MMQVLQKNFRRISARIKTKTIFFGEKHLKNLQKFNLPGQSVAMAFGG